MSVTNYRVKPVVSAPFDQNAFLIWRAGQSEALVVDPGFDTDAILRELKEEGLEPAAILNTHGHADHIAGNRVMKQRFPAAPLVIGRNEAHLLVDADANLSAPFGLAFTSPGADLLLEEGQEYEAAGFRFSIREIPGHSPGSIVFIAAEETPPFAIVGDVVFSGSIGRFDFPGGDGRLLVEGVRSKLLCLPDDTILFPGHGPATTVGRERLWNPYVGRDARDDPDF